MSRVLHSLQKHEIRRLKVTVCVSGGVDSAVSMHLLRKQNSKVDLDAVFLQNWNNSDTLDTQSKAECADKTWRQVQNTCALFGVPVRRVSMEPEYFVKIFQPALEAYASGSTPNPDFHCNKTIKFRIPGVNLASAAIATGHYANVRFDEQKQLWRLHEAYDKSKDQSYFLANLSQNDLSKVIFPVGALLKQEVKLIARHLGLDQLASQEESTGICFVGNDTRFSDILKEHLGTTPGVIKTVQGETIGEHLGHYFYTIGQRIPTPSLKKKHYVFKKNAKLNEITAITEEKVQQCLYVNEFKVMAPVYWISGEEPNDIEKRELKVRVRHLGEKVKCAVPLLSNLFKDDKEIKKLAIKTETPVFAPAPGQFAVFYSGSECLGSAEIVE